MTPNCNPDAEPLVSPCERTERKAEIDHLFLLATERFCSADSHDRLSVHHFKQAFELLYEAVGSPCHQIAARLLAFSTQAPRAIILQLALEDVSISRPVLLHSQVLGQLDLLRLIETCGDDHSALIAQRYDIGPSVVRRLRQFGAGSVARALSENPVIKDRSATASSQPEKRHETLPGQKIKTVSDAPATSPNASKKAESLTGNERRLLDIAGLAQTGWNDTAGPAGDSATEFEGWLHGSQLEQLAEANNHQKIAQSMSAISGIGLQSAYQVLEQQSGESMAVFLKSINVEDACANRILMLCFPAIGLSVRNATGMVRFYSKLDAENCRLAVSRWPSGKATATHQTVYQETTPVSRDNSVPVVQPLAAKLRDHGGLAQASDR